MIYEDVYNGALTLTGSKPASPEASYREYSTYLLPMIVGSLLPLDRLAKKNAGLSPAKMPPPQINLSNKFPLEDEFYPATAYYLAAELVANEDQNLSSMLYIKAEALRRIVSNCIPFSVEEV